MTSVLVVTGSCLWTITEFSDDVLVILKDRPAGRKPRHYFCEKLVLPVSAGVRGPALEWHDLCCTLGGGELVMGPKHKATQDAMICIYFQDESRVKH